MDIPKISRLAGLLAARQIQELEWSNGQSWLRLSLGPVPPAVAGPLPEIPASPSSARVAGEPEPDRVEVTSTAVGFFLDRAPLQTQAMAALGTRVAAGDLVGLLQVGPILLPVRSPVEGVVAVCMVQPGDRIEYRQPIMQLTSTGRPANGVET